MGFFKQITDYIARATLPIYKFENNRLFFKVENDQYYEYELVNYEIKTRHDPYVLEAYTLSTKDIFLEYIKNDSNVSWSGQALSLYEGFIKEKLKIDELKVLEDSDIGNYTFRVYNIDKSFVIHIIYIYTASSNIIIIDAKGVLYKALRQNLDTSYKYSFDDMNRGEINFNISMVKENCLRGYFGL